MDETLVDSVLQLKPSERLRLLEVIHESLDRPDEAIDEAWYEEAKRRLSAFQAGKVQGIPGEQVLGEPPMDLIFDPLAAAEYGEAFDYYETEEEGLGEKFRRAIWAAIAIVEQHPEIGEEVRPGIRKVLVRRFPYKLIYSLVHEGIYIIAVAHGHRAPYYWVDRRK